MDSLLDAKARLADHYRIVARIDAESWKMPTAVPRYRVSLAAALITLATRIAPTVTTVRLDRQITQ